MLAGLSPRIVRKKKVGYLSLSLGSRRILRKGKQRGSCAGFFSVYIRLLQGDDGTLVVKTKRE